MQNLLGGDAMVNKSRTPEIMADAAHVILTSNSREVRAPFACASPARPHVWGASLQVSGNFFIDDKVLAAVGALLLSVAHRSPCCVRTHALLNSRVCACGLSRAGVKDFSKYAVVAGTKDEDLALDFFV